MILLYDRASLRNKCYITGIVKKQKPYKFYICFPLFPSSVKDSPGAASSRDLKTIL